jgi:alcohol dehydrogenase
VRGVPYRLGVHGENTLNFAALHNIRAIVEQVPLADADRAYERMLANQARFRVVRTAGR